MKHLNDNRLCSIAIRTTGHLPREHDLIEISAIFLNDHLEMDTEVMPYSVYIQPTRLENMCKEVTDLLKREDNNIDHRIYSITKKLLQTAVYNGLDESKAADSFVKWLEDAIPKFPTKRILPVCYDWPLVSQFIEDWLGKETFRLCFDQRIRDLHPMALFMNDRIGFRYENTFPFPKTNLRYIFNRLHVNHIGDRSTLSDAFALIEAYRNLCRSFF